MKKEIKIGGLILLLLALGGASYYLYTIGYINYMIITLTLAGICAYILYNEVLNNRSEEAVFNSSLKKILKTYDSILVRSKNIPKLDEKNIITVDSIEDLVDAQLEIRKPIYYQEQVESCGFVLLDNTEACVYILKQNENVQCPLEIAIKEIEQKNKNKKEKKEKDSEKKSNTTILDHIENTTILRVDEDKYVKISPIRDKKKKAKTEETKAEVKTAVKQEVKEAPKKTEVKVTAPANQGITRAAAKAEKPKAKVEKLDEQSYDENPQIIQVLK